MSFRHLFVVSCLALGLISCLDNTRPGVSEGDDTDSTTQTATGQFKDSNVGGLGYTSGSQTGVTGSDGSFTYEVGQSVTFFIGGVSLGTATPGDTIIMAIDLVAGGTSTTTEVLNIVRFLMMLDNDGDPANGIVIAPAVQAAATNWGQVNFSTATLATDLATIIADAQAADGGAYALPSAAVAQAQLEATFRCVHSGGFHGTYADSGGGSDYGRFHVVINANTALLDGGAFSIPNSLNDPPFNDEFITLTGTSPISYDQNRAFVSGNTSTGVSFSGQFTSYSGIAGTYTGPGTFSGSRMGGTLNAVHRFTGNFTGTDDHGIFAFDLDGADNVTGAAYSIVYDQELSLSGTLVGTALSVAVSGGSSASGTLDKTTGIASGTWASSSGSGTWAGSGCRLN